MSDSVASSTGAEDQRDEASPAPQGEPDPRYRLNPAQLPKRLDLTLDGDLLAYLETLAARSGRCLDEIVVDLLDRNGTHN